MENLEARSQKIQNLVLSIPEIASNLSNFYSFPKATKIDFLSPISIELEKLYLSTDEVVDVIDIYSRNLSIHNIDNQCEEIITWLLQKQDADGGWPLAWEPGAENRKNAWANAVCILSLLKFRYYKNIFDMIHHTSLEARLQNNYTLVFSKNLLNLS